MDRETYFQLQLPEAVGNYFLQREKDEKRAKLGLVAFVNSQTADDIESRHASYAILDRTFRRPAGYRIYTAKETAAMFPDDPEDSDEQNA